jgi:hypothetical protein
MSDVESFFFASVWPGLIVWTALYISDYALTLTCARLYKRAASAKIVFEGSFEITPYFQRDIDSLRVISPRFVAALFISLAYLAGVWWFAVESSPALYEFVVGLLVSTELAVHHRHIRNLFLFRAIANNGDALQGRIRYPRPLMLRMSSVEKVAFAGLFAILFAFTLSWFLLGGAIGCLSVAFKHLRLAQKHSKEITNSAATSVIDEGNTEPVLR